MPVRDDSGKVHTNENHNYPGSPDRLPTAEDLKGYATDELEFFRDELTESVKNVLKRISNMDMRKSMLKGKVLNNFSLKL